MVWWKKTQSEEGVQKTGSSQKAGSAPHRGAHEVQMQESRESKDAQVSPEERGKDLEKRYGTVRSALGKGTVIQGKLSFDTPVRIDGELTGEVFSSSVLIVGETGKISADLNVETLIVLGSVSGEVRARKRLELHGCGKFVGSVETPSVTVEEGAHFEGICKMNVQPEQESANQSSRNASSEKVPIVRKAQSPSAATSNEKGVAEVPEVEAEKALSKTGGSAATAATRGAVH
ncbi:MAG: polymer-forming cytoskeletal protein [Bdellovibrionales bacterium]|nr:polymer-forming cytoskeletal protein [Bdellovibrionales bacterium]